MLDSAIEAVNYAAGSTIDDLSNDRMRTLAITRSVEIIGEAAASVSQTYRVNHPEIPWKTIVAMRNRLIHPYFDVDIAVLLATVENDLPGLIKSLKSMV
jgi:uncharacterized protein with HEPN domain